MSDLTLQDLIRLEEPNLDNIKFRITRHVMKGRGWDGFDDLIRLLVNEIWILEKRDDH